MEIPKREGYHFDESTKISRKVIKPMSREARLKRLGLPEKMPIDAELKWLAVNAKAPDVKRQAVELLRSLKKITR